MVRVLLTVAGLDLLYLIALERASLADAAAGAIFAGLFLWWFHRQVFPAAAPRRSAAARVLASVPLIAVGVWRAFASAVSVARASVSRNPGRSAGFVEVPLGDRTRSGTAASALFDSLSPGSVTVEIDEERRVMVLHVMDAADEDAVRADRDRFYQRHQRHAVP